MAYLMCHVDKEGKISNQFNECRRMTLRLRPDVYDAVRRSAFENFRSITAEINELLVEAINEKEKASGSGLATSPDASDSE